jgi:chorismate mutase/prephenate dehydratase
MSVKDKPGALYELLTPFADQGLSMTKIESRPARTGKWEYVFFVEIEGHVEDARVAAAIEQASARAAEIKVLGSYPVALL